MKVRTHLKAGSFLQDAQQQARQLFNDANGMLNEAGQQTTNYAGKAMDKAGRVWNCLVSA